MCKFKAIAAKYSLKQMADNGLLSSTKAIIKCLVISSPEAMTLQRLQADYRESEGREIPYVQLGFRKLEEFLMSIPDVVSVYRDCQILKVRCAKPSGESNSKHIYDLVTHQKKTSTRSNRRRTHGNAIPPRHRRSPPILSQSQPSPMFSLSSPFLPPQQNFSFAPVSPLTMQYFHPMNSSNNQYNAYSHPMLNKFYPNVPAPAFHQSQYINSANEYQKLMQIQHNIAQINRAHQNFQSSSNMALNTNFRNQKPQTGTAVQRMANSPIQKAPTECVSINNLPANIKSIERLDTTSKTNSPSATETSSSVQSSSCISGSSGQTVNSSSSANKIPIIIHTKELPPSSSSSKTAIQTDKNVNMNSVVAAKEIPKPLKENNSYSAPMLRNWNSKKRNVDNLRRVSFDTTDECNNLQAESIEMDSIADLSVVVSDFNITDSNTSDFDGGDEAIPALAEDDIIFQVGLPKDVLRLGTKIAVGKIPDTLVVNSLIPIFVTEIHSPYKFWFHIYSETKELDRLMNNMEHFYKSLNGTEYRIKPQNLRIGQVCAALYLRLWHRGEVVGINEDKVKIYFLDYGTTHDVHMKEVNYLLHEFSELPSQAYRGCLDYIKPVKIRWERDATFSFLALVNDLLLYAKVTNINNEERLVHMILTNTNEAKDIQINEALICKGYAKYFNPYNTNSENGSTSRSKRHFSEKYPT